MTFTANLSAIYAVACLFIPRVVRINVSRYQPELLSAFQFLNLGIAASDSFSSDVNGIGVDFT